MKVICYAHRNRKGNLGRRYDRSFLERLGSLRLVFGNGKGNLGSRSDRRFLLGSGNWRLEVGGWRLEIGNLVEELWYSFIKVSCKRSVFGS